MKSQTNSDSICLAKTLLRVGRSYSLRALAPAPRGSLGAASECRGVRSTAELRGVTVSAKDEGYSDPLSYFSGPMGIVNLNFIPPYLGYEGMRVFTGFDKYIKEQGFLKKEALDKGFTSVPLLLFACLGAS